MANAYYGKKRVLVVGINGTELAEKIERAMQAAGFSGVVTLDAPKSYPGFFTIAECKPEYTIFVEESEGCYVLPCRVDGWPKERVGVYASRNINESQRAKSYYNHQFKMLGLDPVMVGKYKINFEDVEDLPWYWQDESPMLYIKVPNIDGVGDAVAQAAAEYFREKARG